MKADGWLLGLDLGTSRLKAVLLDARGVTCGIESVATPFAAVPGGVEMSPQALRATLEALLATFGAERRRVRAVGIASLAESGVPLDEEGRALGPLVAWHDLRGEETVARLKAQFGARLPARTGQPIRVVSSIAKLGWLLDHGMPTPRHWLGVAELAASWLCGRRGTDPSLASRTGCFDVKRQTYIWPVLRALGLPDDCFPVARPAGTALGVVDASGSAWSGLSSGIPITVAGHDHLVGAEGCGAGPGDLVDSLGTAEALLRYVAAAPPLTAAVRCGIDVSVHPDGRRFVLLIGAIWPGVVLADAAARLGRPEEQLHTLAASSVRGPAGDCDAWLDARGGPQAPRLPDGSPGAVWLGLLMALARRAAAAGAPLEQFAGPPERVLVIGRGATSTAWVRAKAALYPVPVKAVAIAEAVARGAALAAGRAAGWWTSPPAPPDLLG